MFMLLNLKKELTSVLVVTIIVTIHSALCKNTVSIFI
ncbi:hypothetical protein IK1_04145 [Bacillus cereus VD146]|uniref:Uncharacterized protein n=1 Tax=Bacillus cereus (strain VD146) TaxID=1053236 RepID=R8NHW8_BACCX|nr:hypothetical protein IK1_04145 [Bacillus cereus VD146]